MRTSKEKLVTLIVVFGLMLNSGCGKSYTSPRGETAKDIFDDPHVAEFTETVLNHNFVEADRLLDEILTVNAFGSRGHTPLSWVTLFRNLEGMEYLLSRGADPNAHNKEPNTVAPMLIAAAHSSADTLKLLLKHEGDPNLPIDHVFHYSLLGSAAISNQNIEKVKLLIEYGADVNFLSKNGRTALMSAALAGDVDIGKLLIESGADVSVVDRSGRTAATTLFSRTWNEPGLVKRNAFLELLAAEGVDLRAEYERLPPQWKSYPLNKDYFGLEE